ncbi:DUF4426 domain-containing protein [Glaciecola siphonariae]|uniref:DUF4426 domain-containing protein n=1 Tax=Glaciecola siphonariae TaxID=521012 RepID=A0ABV9LVM7_9ALTE
MPHRFISAASGLVLVLLSLVSVSTHAEQKKILGDWEVHYIAFPSTFLSPEVASANNITRSQTRAVINISVLDAATKEALDIDVSGNARNLLGSNKVLEFTTVKEGEAIYHLSTVSFDDKEVLRFTINLKQGNVSQELKFQQKMYEE